MVSKAARSLVLAMGLVLPLQAAENAVKVVNFATDLPCVSNFSSSFDPDSYSLMTQVFDSLIHNDLDGHFIPGLAVEWSQVDDVTYDFTLRKGQQSSIRFDMINRDLFAGEVCIPDQSSLKVSADGFSAFRMIREFIFFCLINGVGSDDPQAVVIPERRQDAVSQFVQCLL